MTMVSILDSHFFHDLEPPETVPKASKNPLERCKFLQSIMATNTTTVTAFSCCFNGNTLLVNMPCVTWGFFASSSGFDASKVRQVVLLQP